VPHGASSSDVAVSAKTGEGFEVLVAKIFERLDIEPLREVPAVTNVRHLALVRAAHDGLLRARHATDSLTGSLSEEFVLADLQLARSAFEEITGRRTSDEVLGEIFSRFCIGK
jgi:tRNA modification GTPase